MSLGFGGRSGRKVFFASETMINHVAFVNDRPDFTEFASLWKGTLPPLHFSPLLSAKDGGRDEHACISCVHVCVFLCHSNGCERKSWHGNENGKGVSVR